MSRPLTCPNCDATIAASDQGVLQRIEFPDAHVQSLCLLVRGLGAMACPKCRETFKSPANQLVLARHAAVLGLHPETDPGLAQAMVDAAQSQVGQLPLHVANDQKSFRRAVIGQLMEPAIRSLNEFVIGDSSLDWVRQNLDVLQPPLFQTIFLLRAANLQAYLSPVSDDAIPRAHFVPEELAPDAARHVVRRREAKGRQARTCGALIAKLLVHLGSETIRLSSLAPIRDDGPARIPADILDEEILPAVAECLGQAIERIDQGQKDWIVAHYALEGALALLCAAHERENPRLAQWTQWCLLYDAQRRLDGNEDVLLLEPEALRKTLARPVFWQVYRTLLRSWSRVAEGEAQAPVGDDGTPAPRVKRLEALIAAAGRAYPDEVLEQTPALWESAADTPLPAAELEARLEAVVVDAMREGIDPIRLDTAMAAGSEAHPDAVVEMIARTLRRHEPAQEIVTAVLRSAIEHLDALGHHDAAAPLAEIAHACVHDIAADHPQAMAAGHLLNEIGNWQRLQGERRLAVASYERALELLGRDEQSKDFRTGRRNLAIVLRELHQYVPAQRIFASLRPHATSAELRGLVTSEALCLVETGQLDEALALMLAHMSNVEGATTRENGVVDFCTAFAFLRAETGGDLQRAAQDMALIRDEAARRQYYAARLVANHIELQRLLRDGSALDGSEQALKDQLGLFARLAGPTMDGLTLATLRTLDRALCRAGQAQAAEALVRKHLALLDPECCPRVWLLALLAARHALARGARVEALADIDHALALFQGGIAVAAATGDVQHFLAPEATELKELVSLALAADSGDASADARRRRYAADATASPVLTTILRAASGLGSPLADVEAEDQRLAALLGRSVAALVQVADTTQGLALLCTTVDSRGRLATATHRLRDSMDDVRRIVRSLPLRLLRTDPDATTLGLDAMAGWTTLAADLRRAFEGLPADRPALVVPGLLQELTVSLALAGTQALCFAPSVAAAVALAERADRRAGGTPAAMFGFATWFDRERADESAALAGVADAVRRLADQHGLTASTVVGREATKQALLDGLAASDLAWIACHGRVRHEAAAIELIVAADGRLASADALASGALLTGEHIVGRADLVGLARMPRLVVSSACDSGVSVTNVGGERVGLERALLQAGTAAFVAPMWPVPSVAIQRVVQALVERILEAPATPVATHLRRVRNRCIEMGISPLAADALALFGDPRA
jgi:tetratricopeptide (TPR) repeat protein